MNRLLPALMAGVALGMAGTRRGICIRADAARLLRWTVLLRHLSLLLREGACTLPQAFEAAAREHAPADDLLRSLAGALRTQPLKPLSQHYLALAQDVPEGDILLRLMTRLGHGTREARVLACDQACEELALLASGARQRADKDAKMWTSLGWTVGLCLALMLL